jgi:hypothetical protein
MSGTLLGKSLVARTFGRKVLFGEIFLRISKGLGAALFVVIVLVSDPIRMVSFCMGIPGGLI